MIGKICVSTFPYFDLQKNCKQFKKRPVLVISGPRNNDYTVLPVSSVSRRANLDVDFDLQIDPSLYPKTNLKITSYIRTHKQTTVHESDIVQVICDLKKEYENLYLDALERLEAFNKKIQDDALL